MSTANYSQMTTDELLRKFVATAKCAGTVFGPSVELVRNTPQRQMLVREMQALGDELRNRKPIEKLRELFVDEDPDIRGWAGPQFISVDPEWADATVKGLIYKLTTQAVLNWRRRLLRQQPRRPRLQEMTVAQLVECFVDACERCYSATRFLDDDEGGGMNMEAYNKAFDDVYAAAKELYKRDELRALLPLLDHPLITVRQKAASYGLAVAPNRSAPVLEAIEATKTWPEFIFASTTLDRWRKGTYRTFPDEPKLGS